MILVRQRFDPAVTLPFVLLYLHFSTGNRDISSSPCRPSRIVDQHAGYLCNILVTAMTSLDVYDSVPRNASALRLTYRSSNDVIEAQLPLIPNLPNLRVLEMDIGQGGYVYGEMFTKIRHLGQLYVFQVASSVENQPNNNKLLSDAGGPPFDGLASLETLVLSDLGLTSVPDNAFAGLQSLRILFLNNNQLTSLRASSSAAAQDTSSAAASGSLFSDCFRLTSLSLARNRISSLNDVAFHGLLRLRSLDLHGNRILSLNREAVRASGLSRLTELVEINLSGNGLTQIDVGTFAMGPIGLRTLYVDANQISDLEPGTFDGLYHLTVLDLTGNRLADLRRDAFRSLSGLESLTLKANRLKSVEEGSWRGLASLSSIDLSENHLTSIHSGSFDGLTNAESLDLSNNMINNIELTAFSRLVNLTFVGLSGNQLTTVDGPFLIPVSRLMLPPPVVFDLSQNAWNCSDCGVIQMVTWLNHANRISINNPDSTMCIGDTSMPLLATVERNETRNCNIKISETETETDQTTPELTSTAISFIATTEQEADDINVGHESAAGLVGVVVYSNPSTSPSTRSFNSTGIFSSSWHNSTWIRILVIGTGCVAVAASLIIVLSSLTWLIVRRQRRSNNKRSSCTSCVSPSSSSSSAAGAKSFNIDDYSVVSGSQFSLSMSTLAAKMSTQRLHLADSLGALVNAPTTSYSPHRATNDHYFRRHSQGHVTDESPAGTYRLKRHTSCEGDTTPDVV